MNFHTLDYDARLTCLEALAQEALTSWGISDAQLDLLTYENNAVYKVTDGDNLYTLRIHRPEHKALARIQAELAWLGAIKQGMTLCVPEPVRPLYEGALDGINTPVVCVLFHWIEEGTFFRDTPPTVDFVRAVGRFAGELHTFSMTYVPPKDVQHTQLDWGGLFGKVSAEGTPSQYDPKEGEQHFTDAQRDIMAQGAEKVRRVMETLGKSRQSYGLIHADLIPKNVMLNGDSVCALDFDECSYGYYLYDLAPMLLMVKGEPNFAELRQALWDGYTAVRPQPADYFDLLETLIAGRHIASCRWIAGNAEHPSIKGKVAGILAGRIARLKDFLDTGVLPA